MKESFPEFWFLMRVLWLSAKPFPRSDQLNSDQQDDQHGAGPAELRSLPRMCRTASPGSSWKCLVQCHPSEQKSSTAARLRRPLRSAAGGSGSLIGTCSSLYTQGFPTATILQLQTQQSSSAQETTLSCEEFQVQNCSCSHGAAT